MHSSAPAVNRLPAVAVGPPPKHTHTHLQCEPEQGALIPARPQQLHITDRLALCGGAVSSSIKPLALVLQHSSTRPPPPPPQHIQFIEGTADRRQITPCYAGSEMDPQHNTRTVPS